MLEISKGNYVPVILSISDDQKKLTWGQAGKIATIFFTHGDIQYFKLIKDRKDPNCPWPLQNFGNSPTKNWHIALKIVVSIITGFIFPIVMGIILAVYRSQNKFALVPVYNVPTFENPHNEISALGSGFLEATLKNPRE